VWLLLLLLMAEEVMSPTRKQGIRDACKPWSAPNVSASLYRGQLPAALAVEPEERREARPEVDAAMAAVSVAVVVHGAALPPVLERLRPGRCVRKYSQVMPRVLHREHDGFSLGHFQQRELSADVP
jgi:hypothetical protein